MIGRVTQAAALAVAGLCASTAVRRRAVGVPDHDVCLSVRHRDDLDDAVGVTHLGAHALRRQAALVSEQVDVPVRVPLRESHPPPRPEGDRRAG